MMGTYCVQVTDGTVTWVTVGNDPEWCTSIFGGTWILSASLVGIGWTYDDENGFRPPSPYDSWEWNGVDWQPPIPYPIDGNYEWDDSILNWVAI